MRGFEMAGTMHLSVTERMIYSLVEDETWEGTVEAPCGAYIGLVLEDRERYLIEAATEQGVAEYWVVQEDSNGFLWFNPCDTYQAYRDYLAEKFKEFVEWDSQEVTYPNVDDCILYGAHGTSVDDDGYCNYCGELATDVEEDIWENEGEHPSLLDEEFNATRPEGFTGPWAG